MSTVPVMSPLRMTRHAFVLARRTSLPPPVCLASSSLPKTRRWMSAPSATTLSGELLFDGVVALHALAKTRSI